MEGTYKVDSTPRAIALACAPHRRQDRDRPGDRPQARRAQGGLAECSSGERPGSVGERDAAAACAFAFARRRGRPAYDVPYVPTPQVVVDEMLRMADVTAADYVDGSGLRRRPHTDHRRRLFRRPRAGHRHRSRAHRGKQCQCASAAKITGRVEFVQWQPVRCRHQSRKRSDDVSAAGHQSSSCGRSCFRP